MSDSTVKSGPSKAPKVRNFETMEGKDLTSSEKESLSRKILLRWLKGKKYEKLKGLQNQMVNATYSEREDLKKKIYENTKKELEQHKTYSKAEQERLAQRFADEILSVADGVGNVKVILKRYERLQEDIGTFNTILDAYVGKGQKGQIMGKLAKNKGFQRLINILERENPILAKRVKQHVRDGNYEKMKAEIVRGTKGMPLPFSAKRVDQFVAAAILGKAGQKSFTGIKTIDGAINWLDKARKVGSSFVLAQAAEDLGIPSMLTFRLSEFTLGQLQQKNNILQRHKHLLEGKETKTALEQEKLVFINGLDKVVKHLEGKIEKEDLKKKFDNSLDRYLAKQTDLNASDKAAIKADASLKDLRVLQLFDLIYGDDQQRENMWGYSLSRGPKMWKAFKTIFLEERKMRKALRSYHVNRLTEWADTVFSQKNSKWKLSGVAEGIGNLERRLSGVSGQIDDLHDLRHRATKATAGTEKALGDAMIEHDKIYRDYEMLVKKASSIMTDQAKGLIGVGSYLETMQKNAGASFYATKISGLPNISDDSLKKLFPGKNVASLRGSLKGGDLVRAYTDQIVELKTMQDVTRSRFAAVANTIEDSVGKDFGKRFGDIVEQTDTKAFQKNVLAGQKELREVVTMKGRGKWAAKNFALPAIILGITGHQLFTGKTKSREAMYDLAEAGMGFIPVVGTAMDIRGAVQGRSFSGKKLSFKERMMYVGFAAVGAVADVATVFGGVGLAMRAGLGGMRTARRSVKAGAALADANKMGGFASDVKRSAYAAELPWAQRQVAKVHGAFNSVQRADKSAEALFTARANEQAALISKLTKHQDSIPALKNQDLAGISNPKVLDEAIQQARRTGNYDALDSLAKLKKLTNSTGMGVNYLKVANQAGKAIDIPKGFFGRVFFNTKAAFLKIKSWLIGIGIPADTIKQYEKSFDAVQAAKRSRVNAVQELKRLNLVKGDELARYQRSYKALHDEGSALNKGRRVYAKLTSEVRDLRKLTRDKTSKLESLTKRHKDLEKLHRAGKASPEQVADAKRAIGKAQTSLKTTKNTAKDTEKLRAAREADLGTAGQKWAADLSDADNKLWGIERTMLKQQDSIRSANEMAHFANTKRSMMELEMMNRANTFARRGAALSSTARYLQYGGMAMGAVWMFSGFNMGPAEQIRNVGKVARPAASAAKWTGRQLFLEDHSGRPPLDKMMGKRMAHIRYKRKLENDLTKDVNENGTQTAVYLARHWSEGAAQELAKKYNCYDQAQDLVERGEVKVSGQALAGTRQKARKAKTKTGAAISAATGQVRTAAGNVSERISNRSE